MDRTRLLQPNRRWMLFVDGENLTKRGQDVLAGADGALKAGPWWRRDVFLWMEDQDPLHAFFAVHRPGSMWLMSDGPPPPPLVDRAARAYYYTSTKSDEPEWTQTRLTLREAGFEPRLFKRVSGKSKAVDVALTTDILTLAAERQYDVAVLFAGDGDYVPVVEAVKRIGLHVVVGFFKNNGLSDELRIAADDFVDLTEDFVDRWSPVEK